MSNQWILAKHRRDSKIPFSAADGYGTMKTLESERDSAAPTSEFDSSPLFLPTNEANLVLPSVGNK